MKILESTARSICNEMGFLYDESELDDPESNSALSWEAATIALEELDDHLRGLPIKARCGITKKTIKKLFDKILLNGGEI